MQCRLQVALPRAQPTLQVRLEPKSLDESKLQHLFFFFLISPNALRWPNHTSSVWTSTKAMTCDQHKLLDCLHAMKRIQQGPWCLRGGQRIHSPILRQIMTLPSGQRTPSIEHKKVRIKAPAYAVMECNRGRQMLQTANQDSPTDQQFHQTGAQ